ncbi:MAG: DUF3465 domain-containing protein [Methylicorpusculum sp.]|uniref:DUF3465 domain-containing protein n=1 Tax=Methylicorpusculum sp. TaxID=2713644 RepID=UPI002717670E|nr:DUF3465 domain-containing protein [Methylicorpusculum sp.]MDO8938072.1 DUF3465 domain-containing protein [Methylicorpusculum sp.]MDP2202181.1 DUF3465 domain-containing protein [Methylicorpusculum sp.]
MKKLIYLAVLAALIFGALEQKGSFIPNSAMESLNGDNIELESAFSNRQSNIQVQGEGLVTRLLPDDLKGSRHQRFILQINDHQTLLIAHNIDLAPKIHDLKEGDTVAFYGEYEWNSKGGVLHWTHHDPRGGHIAGWLKHQGQTYQ